MVPVIRHIFYVPLQNAHTWQTPLALCRTLQIGHKVSEMVPNWSLIKPSVGVVFTSAELSDDINNQEGTTFFMLYT